MAEAFTSEAGWGTGTCQDRGRGRLVVLHRACSRDQHFGPRHSAWRFWIILLLAGGSAALGARTSETNVFQFVNLPIPDGNAAGAHDVRTVVSSIRRISEVRVRATMGPATNSFAFNGDLYIYVRHEDGVSDHLSVLVNRPGRTTTNLSGYADNGMDVTFADDASQDIHIYRSVTNLPSGAPLTGTWQPDARFVDPALVTTASGRSTFLSNLNGMRGDGEWTLFVADLDGGARHVLESWAVEISGAVEPVITWSNPLPITYGTSLSATQLNATASAAGSFLFVPPAGTRLSAGANQLLTAIFQPDDTNAFISTTNTVWLDVQPRALTITAADTNRLHGRNNPPFTGALLELQSGDDVTVTFDTPAVEGSPVGSYAITPTLNDPGNRLANYQVATNFGALLIQPAPLTVLVANTNRVYRRHNPAPQVQLLGLRSGDSVIADFFTPAVLSSPLGVYPVEPVLIDPALKLANYIVTTNSGTLTIEPAPLTVSGITASNKIYDGTLAAALDVSGATLSGVVEGEEVNLVTLGAIGTFADPHAGEGKAVQVTGLELSGADAGNYSLMQPVVTASIAPARLSTTNVFVENKIYDGTAAATLDLTNASLVGVLPGDSVSLVNAPVEQVVYDNTVNDLLLRFDLAGLEAGDEIILAESADDLVRFSFEFWGEGPGGGAFEGDVQVRTRFYRNNGVMTASGYPAPGTVLFDSGFFPISATPRATLVYAGEDFRSLALVPLATPLPASFTWSVQFSGLGPNDRAGIDLYSPPVIGWSYPDYWENDYWLNAGDEWVLKTNSIAPIDFAARFEAVIYAKATFADANVGTQKLVQVSGLTLGGPAAGDYELDQPSGLRADIASRDLFVAADDLARPYGAANPNLTGQLTGVQSGDLITAAFSTSADASSEVGDFPIVPMLNDPHGRLTNYTATVGTLTIYPAATEAVLTSSANPALPGSSVNFAATVSAVAPSTATPAGTVQWRVDDADYGSPMDLSGGVAALITSDLPLGSHTLSIAYSGSGNFLGSTGTLAALQLVDTQPIANGNTIQRAVRYGTKVAVATLLSDDTDPDGEPVLLAGVAVQSVAGGTVKLQDGWIYYAPPPDFTNDDAFSYLIMDQWGLRATGAVSVVALPELDLPPELRLVDLGEGTYRLLLWGVPWKTYGIEFLATVTNLNWQFLSYVVADATGLAWLDDTPPAGTRSRFYRASYSDGGSAGSAQVDVTSSANPAAVAEAVTFTATVIPGDPGDGVPSGYVQFNVDGVAHGSAVALSGGQAALTVSDLPHGAHVITANYLGDGTFLVATGSLRQLQVISSPPLAAPDVAYRAPTGGTKLWALDLLLNDSDPDGDALAFGSVAARTDEGGTLALAEGWIFYTPPTGFAGSDSFAYTVRDALGLWSTGQVEIVATVGNESAANLLVQDLGGGAYRLDFSGVPWRPYTIQYTADLLFPNWQFLGTAVADARGQFSYFDQLPAEVSSRYYRSVYELQFPTGSLFRLAAWTNFIAHTNGRTMEMWSARVEPPGWPAVPPILAWNTNSLIYGFEGFTGLAQCSEFEGWPGQVPVTLLTRRHGYARGHGMPAPSGGLILTNRFAGKKVWFCAADNTVVPMTVAADLTRAEVVGGSYYDYTLLIFTADVPASITPVFSMSAADVETYYYNSPEIPYLLLGTEQYGHVGTFYPGIAPFIYPLVKGGDSGSPNFIPAPDNKVIFISGRGTSGPSVLMQADLDALSMQQGLNPAAYPLRWYDLTPWHP